MKRAHDRAEELGRSLVREAALFDKLLPAIARRGNEHCCQLARGLARATSDRPATWLRLVDAAATAKDEANPSSLIGYISAWIELDPDAGRAVLEDAVRDPTLVRWLPQLEAAAGLDGFSADRLLRALAAGAPVWAFRILVFGRLTDAMSAADLSSLLSAIAAAPDGWAVAIDILAMRLGSDGGDRTNFDLLLDLGRDLLSKIDLTRQSHKHLDHDLATVASVCLVGATGRSAAAAVCQLLAGAFGSQAISSYDLHDFVRAIFRVQPSVALDAFLQPPSKFRLRYPNILSMFEDVTKFHRYPISEIEDEVILNWCEEHPGRNFVAAATSIPYCQMSSDGGGLVWTDLALKLLQKAPEPQQILRTLAARFSPHSWSGSRAAIIEANSQLLTVQEQSNNAKLAQVARQERERLLSEALEERCLESGRSHREDERFE